MQIVGNTCSSDEAYLLHVEFCKLVTCHFVDLCKIKYFNVIKITLTIALFRLNF